MAGGVLNHVVLAGLAAKLGQEIDRVGDGAHGGGSDVFGFLVEFLEQDFHGGGHFGDMTEADHAGAAGNRMDLAIELQQLGQARGFILRLAEILSGLAQARNRLRDGFEEGLEQIGLENCILGLSLFAGRGDGSDGVLAGLRTGSGP